MLLSLYYLPKRPKGVYSCTWENEEIRQEVFNQDDVFSWLLSLEYTRLYFFYMRAENSDLRYYVAMDEGLFRPNNSYRNWISRPRYFDGEMKSKRDRDNIAWIVWNSLMKSELSGAIQTEPVSQHSS